MLIVYTELEMATSKLSGWDGWCTSQLQIVLLGGRNSGKTSVGNLILGKEEFVTKERTSCLRRLGMVAGRWITVVDAPGWWCDFTAEETPDLVKRAIVDSVSLCSPGPHVFLITVKASSVFSERRRRAVEEHVGLLGDAVWGHCVVVLTSAYRQYEGCVGGEGEALRWLTEKCGHRCHTVVLNDDAEQTELLVKIQDVVMKNGNRAFEMHEDVLRAAAEEKRGVDERARRRFMRLKHQRCLTRERSRPVTHMRLVLLGAKGSGKTWAANTVLGREASQTCRRTAKCWVGQGPVFGRQLTVVDTPGWWMNYFLEESTLFDQREMALSLSLCPPGPHAFLLVIRVDRAFTENYRRAAQEHLELISEHIWNRVILVFSFGDWLAGTTTEQYIESEGEALQWLVEKCRNRYHVLNSKTKGDGFQVRELIGKIEEMMSDCNRGWHYEMDRRMLETLERGMKEEMERATDRRKKKNEQRQMARSQLEKLQHPPELRLILVGGRKVGKSSCGNAILNTESFGTDAGAASCTEKRGQIAGKIISVLDTPESSPLTSDLLTASCALLLVVNVSSSFTGLQREALEKQLEAAGGQVWSRAMVLFSHGDWLGDTSIEQRIESEGEPLQRLVEQCGNRYHVLDNKNWGDGAQARELIELVEETLVGERLHRGDHMWKTICTTELRSKERMSSSRQLSHDFPEAAEHVSPPSLTCSGGSSAAAQALVLPARRSRRPASLTFVDRRSFLPYMAAVLSGKQRLRWLMVDLPFPFPAPHSQPSLHLESLSPRHQTVLLVSCQTRHRMSSDRPVMTECARSVAVSSKRLGDSPPSPGVAPSLSSEEDVHPLCHPALRERALRRLSQSGDLQALIDQWGHSSLQELEAFIDSYFEMVWEQTMGSVQPPDPDRPAAELDAAVRHADREEVLCSIDRKLSKLELLEEIRRDLAELRLNQECSWRAIQELRDQSKTGSNETS
ncbi:GTPase IMAP family member 8 [Cololabis saira]|uniref:GTPase IMAP family member 8 n=1 Tax=Cololabis saira TaxID=129043 RepID=UPI002AD57221|nr:GTPase IMAP family member 8 [Cololabis saira]